MERRTVLLVHAGAPSSKYVDQQAIAQAESYLSLQHHEPAKKTLLVRSDNANAPQATEDAIPGNLARGLSSDVLVRCHNGKELSNESASAPTIDRNAGSSASFCVQNSLEYIDDTQLAYTALESQLYTSSAAAPTESGDQRRIQLKRQAKRPRRTAAEDVEHDISSQQVQDTPSATPVVTALAVDVPVGTIESELRIAGTLSSDETTSELPRSYSWGDSTSNGRSNSIENRHMDAVSEHRPIASQDDHHVPVPDVCHNQVLAAVREPPSAEDPTRQLDLGVAAEDQINVEKVLERAHEAVPHLSGTAVKQALAHSLPQPLQVSVTEPVEAELLALSPEIHAPKPKISVKRFETSVTKELRELYDKFGTKFDPIVVSRQIDTLERGYWSINCTAWSASKKLAFWRFLEIWIGNGSAGWSVWCTRVADQQLGPDVDNRLGASTSGTPKPLDHLRVYCWGEIIGHIYVLLYTASEGGIRKLGLQWIDSNLKVVVQMRSQMVTRSVSAIGAA